MLGLPARIRARTTTRVRAFYEGCVYPEGSGLPTRVTGTNEG